MNQLDQYTQLLYNHKFDVDDIIYALCAATPSMLDTKAARLIETAPLPAAGSHCFLLEPLPAAFLAELRTHDEISHLNEADKAELFRTLDGLHSPTDLQGYIHTDTRLGGWLRERVKEAALTWLDQHNLIPPSMRHVWRVKAAPQAPDRPTRITLSPEASA